jgi:UDP-glucose 4-epimerase
MERIANGQPPIIFGDGTQTMDFVHVHDIARANILAAKAEVTDRVYNIASATETSLLDLAKALLSAMDSNLAPEHGPDRAVNGVTRRLADISSARRDLGWEPRLGLDEGLRELVAWWRRTAVPA